MATIAYFSAEYSVADDLPIYAGGLGILAGDLLMEAGREGRDFHALGLVYHEAFTGDDPSPKPLVERLVSNGFALIEEAGKPLVLTIALDEQQIYALVWRKAFGSAYLYLLDCRTPENSSDHQRITDQLYDDNIDVKVAQQLVLGFGGVALLEHLEIKPDKYHLNEGHMAFAGLAVAVAQQAAHPELSLLEAIAAVRSQLVATKHTILPGAGIRLSRAMLDKYLSPVVARAKGSTDDLMQLGNQPDGTFSTTKLLLALASRSSGVSQIHVRAEAELHPGSPLIAITNGVYVPRWQVPSWPSDAAALPAFRKQHKQALLDYAHEQTGVELDPNRLTIVWARRMTAYKRPELLVSDLDRLRALVGHTERPVQFIVAGQANPADTLGISLMNQVITAANDSKLKSGLVHLPHYNPATARLLVQGADAWLNTPIRGEEACGTSGMKASLNGALQFSTSDGWFDEIDRASLGWTLAETDSAANLYDTLENEIAPQYYNHPETWQALSAANIALAATQFSAARMLHDYEAKLYS